MAKLEVARFELTPEAKAHLEGLAEKKGMTQTALLSRILEWYSKQGDLITAAIMGHYPAELQSEIAKLILDQMPAGKKK